MNNSHQFLKTLLLSASLIGCLLSFNSCGHHEAESDKVIDWQIEFKKGITEKERSQALTELSKRVLDYLVNPDAKTDSSGTASTRNAALLATGGGGGMPTELKSPGFPCAIGISAVPDKQDNTKTRFGVTTQDCNTKVAPIIKKVPGIGPKLMPDFERFNIVLIRDFENIQK